MNLRRIKDNISAATNMALIILIGILLISGSSVVILIYDTSQNEKSPAVPTARWGDKVLVDYIGRLADGRVFDTSLWEVASNDALYPKSLSFKLKNQSAYQPLQVQIGTGSTIRGFEEGLIGMKINETKVIEVPPQLGYGELNVSKLITIHYMERIPVFEDLNFTEFQERFETTPVAGKTLTHPQWGWDVTVLSVDYAADRIRVWNAPALGEKYPVYGADLGLKNTGWYVLVESYDSTTNDGKGEIVLRHLIEQEDAGQIKGIDSSGTEFILYEVNPDKNTVVLNYNGELVGQTLYFTVTLVDIL